MQLLVLPLQCYLGKRSTMFWHHVMKPNVTSEAADTASAQSIAHPTASMKADRKELSMPRYINIDSLLTECTNFRFSHFLQSLYFKNEKCY